MIFIKTRVGICAIFHADYDGQFFSRHIQNFDVQKLPRIFWGKRTVLNFHKKRYVCRFSC